MFAITPAVSTLIDLALEEDLGRGDVTSSATIGPELRLRAQLVAREALVLAGLDVARHVFDRVGGGRTEFAAHAADGETLTAGAVIGIVDGPALGILAAERTALNFLQRLSGVATATRTHVAAVQGFGMRVTDTRKTTPGFRALEKYAVRMGGGANHRFDLGSGVLIKDNHVAVAGSVTAAVTQARAVAPHGLKIEVEVDSLAQLEEALTAGADIVLLDNFTDDAVETALARVRQCTPRPLVEVSGGLTLGRLPRLAALGVDLVSIGALTHSARAVDIALDSVASPALGL